MSDAYPRPETEPLLPPGGQTEPRNPWGWIALGLLFAYLMFGAAARPNSDRPEARVERYTARLENALRAYNAGESPLTRALTGESETSALEKLERELEPKRRTEPIEAGFWIVVRRHLGQPVTEKDLAPLARDRDYRILADAERSGKRTKAEALALVEKLEKRGAASKLAADHLRPQAGLPRKATKISGFKLGVVALGLVGLLFASAFAWLVFLALAATGALPNLGPATTVPSGAAADRLAVRAAVVIAAFLTLQTAFGTLARAANLDSRVATMLAFAGMLVAVPLILRGSPSMAEVGLTTRHFLRNVGIGLWAFLLEIPVTGGIAIVCALLLRNLPQPEHPASTTLMNSPDLLTVVATFFGGAIVAPFWEETMFRGLLYPALRKVVRGPIPAALVSSFLFASIHPQGPVLWAALASVALFSCFLAQRTGSLVPSIAMHCAHNTVLLGMTVLISQ